MRFINTVVLIDDEQEYNSQVDYDTAVLSAAVVYMADYYKRLFDGLDSMIQAVNDINFDNEK